MPNWMKTSLQDSNSPNIEQVTFFHDTALVVLILITGITLLLVTSITTSNSFNNFLIEEQSIETIWTISPAFLLISLALPSLNTLYIIEDPNASSISINALGHQWYWSYEVPSNTSEEIESFIENSNTLRVLNTSEILNLPSNVAIRTLVTSADVIHSWAIPAIGVNADALPGRLNQAFLLSNRVGIFSGQCSEICGINHSFIPILIVFNTPNEFSNQ